MPDQLPEGFRFLDEEAPAPAASAPSLPAGFRFLDEPAPSTGSAQPANVPLPPRRPDDINALPTVPQPANAPMPAPRPPEFGSVNDDAGVGAPTTTQPAGGYAGDALSELLGAKTRLTPEEGQAEKDAKVAAARQQFLDAQKSAAAAKTNAPAVDAAQSTQLPTFGEYVAPPSGTDIADNAANQASDSASRLVDAQTTQPPQLTPGRQIAEQGINAAGHAVTGAAGIVGKAQRDFLGQPAMQQGLDKANSAIDRAFTPDPGRADELGTKVAGAVGGMAPLLPLAAWSAPAAAAFSAMGGANTAYEKTEGAQAEGKQGIFGGNPLVDRWLSAIGGGAIGAAQMAPFSRLLGRMEEMAPGSVIGAVGQAAKSGAQTSVEQVLVQGLSTLGENGIHKLLADKDQALLDGVKESAEIAGIVGGALGIGGAAWASATNRAALADRIARSTPQEIDAFLGTVKGKDSRADIDDFLKQKAAADAAKEAQNAPALPAPGKAGNPAESENSAPQPGGKTDTPPATVATPATEANPTLHPTPAPQPGDATLRAMGYGDEEIALMGPGQRAAELAQAAQEGISVPDEPTDAAGERAGAATPAVSDNNATDTAESGTRAAPVQADRGQDIAAARDQVDTAPTPAQIEAGNYRKGHVTFDGLPISIENPKGSTRSGTAPDGTPWQTTLPADYGYIKGSKGADGDHVDVYVGPKPPNGRAFVVDQHDPATGKFDEHKIVLGVDSAGEAARLYSQAFSDGSGPSRIGAISEVPTPDLKAWLAKGEQKAPIGSSAPIQLPPGFKELVVKQDEAPKPADTTGGTTQPAKPATPAKPRPRTGPPQTLVSFLKQNGGIKDSGGELRARDLHKRFPGLVNNKSGRPLDDARLIAAESGYLGHDTEEAMQSTFIDDLLNKIEQHPTYSAHDEKELIEHQVKEGLKAQRDHDLGEAEDAVHADLTDAGTPENLITYEHLREAARLVVDEGVPVQDAYERAVMSATLKEEGPEARDLDADIPWDDYEPTAQTEAPRADQGREEGEGDSAAHVEEGAGTGEQVGEEGRGDERPEETRTPESTGEGSPRGVEAPSAPRAEAGADGKPQLVLAGAEKIGDGELVQRKADESLKPKAPQKDADGLALFGDGHKQTDLLDLPKPAAKAPENITENITSAADQVAPIVEAPPAGQKSLSPFDPSKSVPDAVADYLYRGEAFANIVAARKFVNANGGSKLNNKQQEEAIEHGVVKAARAIVAESKTPAETYDRLVALYANQPRLGTRTSTSVEQQAYSTPAPLAYIASELAGIGPKTKVLEPTAGNGMLLIAANPKNVLANEINEERGKALSEQGFHRFAHDASSPGAFAAEHHQADAVIANPPFGVVKDDIGETKRFDLGDIQPGYRTGEIDHVISLRALDAMKDDGRAVLILGGINKLVKGEAGRSDAYNGKAKREFFHVLYNRYNVTDHFTVAGELYEKQGAGYPIDVIAINGRGKSARALPSVDVPPVLRSWDELKEKLNVAQPGPAAPRAEDHGAPGVPSGTSEPAGPRALDAEHQADDGRVGHPAERPEEGSRGVRDGRGSGEPGNTGPAGEPAPGLQPAELRDAGRPGELAPASRNDGVKPAPARQEQETEGQSAYRPKSEKAQGLGTLVPKNMRRATEEALAKVAKSKGSVDELVASALGMKAAELSKYFAAEQVDALALAIHNLEKGSGFIIGDQTGIGKGRVNAAIIRYALHNQFTPIFVTEKPNLYGDMYRDLKDIGIVDYLGREPRIQMTNTGERVPLDDEGKVFLKTPDAKTHNAELQKIGELGVLPNHDMIFTTYNQMQTVKGNGTPRQAALRGLIRNAVLILDESHNAGGTEAGPIKPKGLSRSVFARQLVDQAKGVFYSSATYAKRPSVMDLYSKTDMSKAVEKPEQLAGAIAGGGVPMQQVVASMLAEAGQYIRRERSFAGVTYEAKVVPVDRKGYEDFSSAIAAIHQFSGIMKAAAKNIDKELKSDAKRITPDGSTGGAGAQSTNFTSIMHNLVNQVLLAQKAGPATQMAIEAVKNGHKPVLTVANTMESFLQEYAQEHNLKPGDPVVLSFRDLLNRYLERTRTVLIKKPFSAEAGEKRYLSDAELGGTGVILYKAAKKAINKADVGSLPVSPIDYMRDALESAGHKVGEITGRTSGISYADPSTPRYYIRSGKETSIAGRRKTISEFNSGGSAAMILNQAGATGLSLHASEKVKDQRRRHMILVQPEGNIDTHMQMLGRVHRTGQVITPEYSQLVADIPAEKRPAAILAKKMASLNASTTAARDGALTADNVVDFMNEYGDEVAYNIMSENPEINRALGDPVEFGAESREGAMRKLTGRIPLLPIKRQEELYRTLESAYTNLIAEKEAAGENALEAKRLDLDAKPVSSMVVKEGKGDSPFTQPVRLETLDVKRQSKPYTAANLIEDAAKAAEVKPHADPAKALEQIEAEGKKQNALQVKAAFDAFRPYAKEMLSDIENEATRSSVQARLDDNEKRFAGLMDVARVGRQVAVVSDDQRFSGIITKVYRDGDTQNPLALGSWKVKLAIPGKGQVPLPFSKLYTDVKPAGREDDSFYKLEATLPDSNVLTHFDDMAKEAREQRVMLTGNLLAAYAYHRGQIVHYTDHEGAVHQGVLLPGSVKNAEDVMRGKGVPLKGGQAVMDELNARGPGVPLSAANEPNVAVSLDNRGALIVSVPGSKAQGGKYFLNRDIREAANNDFIKRGGVMRLEVPRYGEREKVLDALMALGVKFEKLPEETETKAGRVGKQGEAREIPPEFKKIIRDALHAAGIAQRIAGKHASVDVAERIELSPEAMRASGAEEGENAAPLGVYDQATRAIEIALGTGEESRVAHHEAFHALEDADVFHAEEKAILNRELPRMRQIVAKEYGMSPEALARMPDYEIRAYAYEAYAHAKEAGGPNAGAGLHIGLRRLFNKVLDFFRRLRNALHGAGFHNMDDVLERVRTGEMGQREAGPNSGQALGKQFARIKTPGRRRYFENESFLDRAKRKASNAIDPSRAEENFLDLSAPVRNMQAGHQVGPGQDVYKAKRLLAGKLPARAADFERDYVKPLAADMKAAGLSTQDVGEYALATHAPERNARMDQVDPNNNGRGSGITNDEAQRILNELKSEGKLDTLQQKIEPRLQAMREFILDTRINSGTMSDEQADSYREMYQHYVDLRGWEDPTMAPDDVRRDGSGKVSVRGPETRHAFGRPQSVSDNPVANLIDQAHRAIERAQHNDVGKTLWRWLKSMPKDERDEIATLDKGKMTKMLDDTTGTMRWVEEPGWRNRQDVFAFKIGGQPHYVVFKDPRLAEAMNRLHPEQLGLALGAVAKVVNAAKSLWTHYEPNFIFAHFFMRYPIEGMMNAGEQGLGAMLRSFKGYPGGPAMRAILAADRMSTPDRAALAQKFASGKATDAERWQHYYLEMRDAGGIMKFSHFGGVENAKRRLDSAIARRDQNPVKAMVASARAAHEVVDHILSSMDNAQRLAAYVEARKAGATPSDAAMRAREATIDFALKGRLSKHVNVMWPFGNTAAQTASRMTKAVGRSGRMRAVIAAALAVGVAQGLYNYLYGGNDKDGTPFYEKVAEWTRRLNLVMMSPFKDDKGRPYYGTVALPYNYAFPIVVGTAIAQLGLKTMGIAKQSVGSILHNVLHSGLEALTPMAQENSLIGKLTMEPLRPFLHVAMNESFAGFPIHKDEKTGLQKGIARAEQGKPNTPEFWKSVAKGVNNVTGGDRYKSGAVDLAPEDYREVAGYMTSAQERLITHTANMISDMAHGHAPKIDDVPIARRAAGGGEAYDKADTGAYYDARKKAFDAEASYKKAAKENPAEAKRMLAENGDDIRAARMFHAATHQIGQIYRQIDSISADKKLSADEIDTKTKPLRDRLQALMNRTRDLAERRQSH